MAAPSPSQTRAMDTLLSDIEVVKNSNICSIGQPTRRPACGGPLSLSDTSHGHSVLRYGAGILCQSGRMVFRNIQGYEAMTLFLNILNNL